MNDRKVLVNENDKRTTDVHRPFTNDGVTYCGWDGHDGCGEVWPCFTVQTRASEALDE